jgi:hypothetical protein
MMNSAHDPHRNSHSHTALATLTVKGFCVIAFEASAPSTANTSRHCDHSLILYHQPQLPPPPTQPTLNRHSTGTQPALNRLNMSFAALPTELDTRIISFMDHCSLDNMSRSSKYYRQITEPFLYRHLDFTDAKNGSIKRLGLALLARRPLARYITSFACNHDRYGNVDPDLAKDEGFSSQMLNRLPVVQKLIGELLGPGASAADQLGWLSSLISVESSVDRFIALILSFATNLDNLDYDLYALKVTARSLQTPSASTTSASSTTPRAFSKLRHLSIVSTNETTIPIAPTLETLKICESDCVTLTGPSGYHGALKLHTLDVKNSSLMWDKLLEVVRAGHLTEVAEIRLAGVSYKSALGLVIDQNPLVEALAAHMPKLEHLEWDCLDDDRQLTLTDLSGLTGVTTLRIELRLVSTKLHFLDPERSTALLPPNLHALNVSSMSLTDLDRALRKFSEGERASFVRSVVDLAARFPLRSL